MGKLFLGGLLLSLSACGAPQPEGTVQQAVQAESCQVLDFTDTDLIVKVGPADTIVQVVGKGPLCLIGNYETPAGAQACPICR